MQILELNIYHDAIRGYEGSIKLGNLSGRVATVSLSSEDCVKLIDNARYDLSIMASVNVDYANLIVKSIDAPIPLSTPIAPLAISSDDDLPF